MANIYPTTVASKVLVAGDKNAGFFGEVPVSELWSGQQLSSLLGITQGTLQHSNEPWLKFIIDGKVIYKSKKPFRHSISWNHLNEKGLVYGNKIIEDKYGNQYKVRLMKGALTDPAKDNDPDKGAKGSEWNRLMLPIHEGAKNKNWHYPAFVEDEIPSDWNINYTDNDLVTNSSGGNGHYQWCQETPATYPTSRLIRGNNGVSFARSFSASGASSALGWSPVLELISEDITFIKDNNTLHTKEGEKLFTKENLIEENGYELEELDRKLTTFNQPLESESFYKKSTINLKKYFDIHSIGVGGRLVEKKIDFNMTSNTTPAPYVVSASSEHGGSSYQSWKPFKGTNQLDTQDCWLANSKDNQWIEIRFGDNLKISKIIIEARRVDDGRDLVAPPKNITILHDGGIQDIEIKEKMKSKERFEIKLNEITTTSFIRININSFYERSTSPNVPAIGRIEIYELVKE